MNKKVFYLISAVALAGIACIVALNRMYKRSIQPKVIKWTPGIYSARTFDLSVMLSRTINSTILADTDEQINFQTGNAHNKLTYLYRGEGVEHRWDEKVEFEDAYKYFVKIKSMSGTDDIFWPSSSSSETYTNGVFKSHRIYCVSSTSFS